MPFLFNCPIWKIATGIGLAICLVLSGCLVASYFENRKLTSQREALSEQINDPRTGFVVRLAQANTNVETLKTALNTQRQSFEIKAAERERVLASTARQLAVAQQATHTMQLKLDRFLATKPRGATLDERVRDIDQRGLAEMVQ